MTSQKKTARTIVGTGLIVLDITVSATSASPAHSVWAGGTCGNVLSILSFLGWKSHAIGRIGHDAAATCLARDLLDAGVDPTCLEREPGGTPTILHRVSVDRRGGVRHGYAFECPQCDRRYASFRPILVSRVESVNTVTSNADVFFFDRVSRGILDLAAIARQNGATIVFEPSASCDEKHFLEAYALSDIVKYARDRRPKFAESLDKAASHRRATLEIETRGADGLAFRLGTERRWRARGAVRVEKLRDASGAGDWLTAGFLYAAAREGAISSALADASSIEKAFAIGQALAAFNCQFEGPRGAMYASSADTTAQMLNVVDTRARRMLTSQPKRPPLRMTLTGVCATCAGNARGTPRNHGGIPSTAAKQVRVPRARARVGLL